MTISLTDPFTNAALPSADWTRLGAVTEVSPGQFQFTDPQAATGSQRLYRVRSPYKHSQ
jgi:hypothetical protein